MLSIQISSRFRIASVLSGVIMLAGCATLPSTGPTAHEIRRDSRPDRNTLGFTIVDIDQPTITVMDERLETSDASKPTLASLAQAGRNDAVGPGDTLAVGIYEVGASLFGSARETGTTYDPSARGESFPTVVVDRDGTISLPYVGRLRVAGHAPADVQAMIEHALQGKSQNPQVLVSVRLNVSSTVYVSGDVRRAGRFDLSLQNERLLDAIALGGGAA